jgi:tetratricopeptide (TPR) repeat protein
MSRQDAPAMEYNDALIVMNHPTGTDRLPGSVGSTAMTEPDDTRMDPGQTWQEYKEAGEDAERHQRVLEAEEYYLNALQVAEGLGPEDPRLAETLTILGRLYSHSPAGPPARVAAERHLERALALREQALGPDHVEVARVLVLLSGVIFQRSYQNGRAEAVRAASFLERALAIQERLGRSDRLLTAETSNTLINVASALGQHGRATEAEALYRRFIAVVERIYMQGRAGTRRQRRTFDAPCGFRRPRKGPDIERRERVSFSSSPRCASGWGAGPRRRTSCGRR